MNNVKFFKTTVTQMFSIKRIVHEFTLLNKFDLIIMTVMLFTQIGAFVYSQDFTVLGVIGFITGIFTIISLIMINRGFMSTFFWGTLGALVWLVIALSHRLIGDVASQIYYFIMQFVGAFIWLRQMDKTGQDSVESKKLTKIQGVGIALITLIIYFLVVKTSTHFDGNQILLDATLLPLGIVGQLLMTYGYRSQWFFWITLNLVNVVIWSNQLGQGSAALSMFTLQIVMLINSIYGAYLWINDYNTKKNNESKEVL